MFVVIQRSCRVLATKRFTTYVVVIAVVAIVVVVDALFVAVVDVDDGISDGVARHDARRIVGLATCILLNRSFRQVSVCVCV
jgi:hypothetical protein